MRNNFFTFKLLLSFCLCLLTTSGKAQHAFNFHHHDQLQLKPYFRILEDDGHKYNPNYLLSSPHIFQAINGFKPDKPDHSFWLFTSFKADTATTAVITFRHLTFAELYLQADTPNAPIIHRKAGVFRPLKEIDKGDSRFHFSVDLEKNLPYKILIKSTHVKGYTPIFDFELTNKNDFLDKKVASELSNLFLQGASALLILYTFLSWLSTRYRPFLWLMIFATGFHLYDIALNRYLIDWLSPNSPQNAWLGIQTFLHIGLFGLFLLLIDSWNIKAKNYRLFQYGRLLLAAIFVLSAVSFSINYSTLNYNLTTKINIIFSFLPIAYAVTTLLLIWHKLDKQERYLAYGLILYLMATLFFNITISLWGEKLYLFTPIGSKIVSISVVLLFLTGLNARLRQNEKDKLHYLNELNQLQKHQNELLEESVALRTSELNQRNQHIETLMNELNHRVKNNLQLLYSLNSLQLPTAQDTGTTDILKDNISRIKAMMLVNESLNLSQNVNERATSLNEFITAIVAHSKRMFVTETLTDIQVNVDETLILDSKLGLSLGLIVSELLTNSFKHAFSHQPKPIVAISISVKNSKWQLLYHDNGSGLKSEKENTFGLMLIKDLTRQLKGNLETSSRNGLAYIFNFPNTA